MVLPSAVENGPTKAVRRAYAALDLRFLRSPSLLAASLTLTVGGLGVARLVLPVSGSFLAVAFLALIGASALAGAEVRRNRIVSLNLFALALMVRVIALTSLSWGATRDGGSFLGIDSIAFLRGATYLATHGFHLGMSPVAFFGTYNVAQYYLFAAAIRYLHADLFALQMMNAGLTAFAAPLTFSIFRHVLPRVARASGLLVGLYPSLIVLSVVDLLKDPSVLAATLLAVWTVATIMRARRPATVVCLAGPGLIALLYLRTGRFYALGYMEAGLVGAAAWIFIVARKTPVRRPIRTAVVGLVAMFAACEAVPQAAGWPISPVLFEMQFVRAAKTPALMNYSEGLVDRLADENTPSQPPRGAVTLSFGANLVRRVFGPFPWIRPQQWSVRYLEANNYLLYPGMLVWYSLLPVTLLGLLLVGRDIVRRADVGFAMAFVWLFTVPYCLQYLAINLSYRQRDVMFPILVVFAAVGSAQAISWPSFGRWYRRYWIALALLATAHLTVRGLSGL